MEPGQDFSPKQTMRGSARQGNVSFLLGYKSCEARARPVSPVFFTRFGRSTNTNRSGTIKPRYLFRTNLEFQRMRVACMGKGLISAPYSTRAAIKPNRPRLCTVLVQAETHTSVTRVHVTVPWDDFLGYLVLTRPCGYIVDIFPHRAPYRCGLLHPPVTTCRHSSFRCLDESASYSLHIPLADCVEGGLLTNW